MIFKIIEQSDLMNCAKEMALAFEVAPWNEHWTIEQAYERFDEIMSGKSSLGYCIYDEDEVVCTVMGRILTYLDYKEYWIDDFSVHPDYQSQGIGSQMFEYIRNDLKNRNVKNIVLNTNRGYPCVQFYTKNHLVLDEKQIVMSGKVNEDE